MPGSCQHLEPRWGGGRATSHAALDNWPPALTGGPMSEESQSLPSGGIPASGGMLWSWGWEAQAGAGPGAGAGVQKQGASMEGTGFLTHVSTLIS